MGTTTAALFEPTPPSTERIRTDYVQWLSDNEKELDEERYQVFAKNYVALEKFAKANGRELVLNAYADCTEQEYRTRTGTAPVINEEEEVVEVDVEDEVVVSET